MRMGVRAGSLHIAMLVIRPRTVTAQAPRALGFLASTYSSSIVLMKTSVTSHLP